MFKSCYVVVVLVLAVCVLLQVCLADAKGKGRKGRRRRCPKACVQKFDNYQKGPKGDPGPTGRQGPPGRPGLPGPKGDRLILPVCKPGEYLTSDGLRLICKKLDLTGLCYNAKKSCPSDKPDPQTVTLEPEGKRMIKFMAKNKIQSVKMDAWDVEAFYIGRSLFVGLSQLGTNSFIIFQWDDSDPRKPAGFRQFQEFKISSARNWSPFKIGDDQFFVIATSSRTAPCPIYRWDTKSRSFKNFTYVSCKRAFDVQPFKIKHDHFIAVANYYRRRPCVIFKWNGLRFREYQKIDVAAMYVETFNAGKDIYLSISGPYGSRPHVFMYKWDGAKFVRIQKIHTAYRPYQVTALSFGDQHFIAVATRHRETKPIVRDLSQVMIYKLNNDKFQNFQNISSSEARRVSSISSPLMGKHTYLAVVNAHKFPVIYAWDRKNGDGFKSLQTIESKNARDISFFEMGDNVYLLVTSHTRLEVFKGAKV